MVHDFLTGLQFLTRINLARQTSWSPESFGRSVRYFPLVGVIIGMILASLNLLAGSYLPSTVLAALLITLEIILTGGLHGDGLMDTADGIFSARTRERMLEIMKDSRVGANGVMAFCLFVLVKWSLLMELPAAERTLALLVMPVLSRFAMVMGITLFPYARPDGIGKAFAQYAGRKALYIAALLTAGIIIFCGKAAWISMAAIILFAILFGHYVTNLLGSLTGDIYGAITELSGVIVLMVYIW